MTTAKPPARYGANYGRACGRLRYTELHHAVGHDRQKNFRQTGFASVRQTIMRANSSAF
jgi:hypothetical protein